MKSVLKICFWSFCKEFFFEHKDQFKILFLGSFVRTFNYSSSRRDLLNSEFFTSATFSLCFRFQAGIFFRLRSSCRGPMRFRRRPENERDRHQLWADVQGDSTQQPCLLWYRPNQQQQQQQQQRHRRADPERMRRRRLEEEPQPLRRVPAPELELHPDGGFRPLPHPLVLLAPVTHQHWPIHD